ncbi:hypothetical protein GBAR_LOCUS3749 [Geodia barretti]|uniref:Uncharacterized protein n=1 Tax=Geodia barretti TaxID=519541 RepID=A0AA35W1Z0_GEOBA|nr:hypothetical protein GBAR_LOCUS3749 [Geodia barretti]
MTVILSPDPSLRAASTRALAKVCLLPPLEKYFQTSSLISSAFRTSHTPSQATTRKSSVPSSSTVLVSASAVINFLSLASPMALDTERLPLTRHAPSQITIPPSSSILSLSSWTMAEKDSLISRVPCHHISSPDIF